ncbi:MAG: class B sortase [Firmicutes bacterium]|nr:class B sortase [Bacillota bacterium]
MLIIKDKRKKLKDIIIFLVIILLILSVLCINLVLKRLRPEIFKVENRTSNIEAEKQKDNTKYYKTIGWLRVEGTNIDTPIIGYNDEDIDAINIDKENYLWNENPKEKLFNKVSIMGHNILNLSSNPDRGLPQFTRFDDLMSFVYYDFAKENKYIEYTVDGKDYVYKIFAVSFDKQYNLNLERKYDFSEEELKDYIKYTKKNSIYNYDVDVNKKDKYISLVTCTRMYASLGDSSMEFVVHGRMVRENERLTNYKVTKNKNYKKIEKIMKGSAENDTNA